MFDSMKFSGTWRDYQARALGEMADHLGDDRLHVVAAPGAGKTILGLELVNRLGRPALVFAPSLAIRDQWHERLAPLFMAELPGNMTVSRDLSEPKTLTLSTFQSLDSFRRSDSLTALITKYSEQGPFTLVLDEAHHLRMAWWDCLNRLATELKDVKIVALTATPPYDASLAEWNRYEGLCGPIDLEIGIPELVRNGDLCPHQDHLILSKPTEDALALLERRRRTIADLHQDLHADHELLDWLEQQEWLSNPASNVEAILEAPEMLSAALILLGSAGRPLPKPALDLLGVSARDLPLPSLFWLEQLLDGLVFKRKAEFPLSKERRDKLQNRLHRHGLIEGGRVRLRHTRSVFRLLASSIAKMESIVAIAEAEQRSLGEQLRMVVLSDHIRAGELPRSSDADFKLAKLGVAPIFETLRRAEVAPDRLAVLTGSLVIVPRMVSASLDQILVDLGLPASAVRQKDIEACPDHIEIQSATGSSADLTRIVTALFMKGDIRILVGTQSLLGQGWDAPALNSLILASNTASFMLSNQMRGRAIRIDPESPNKVSNIWHLATIEPDIDGLREALATSFDWGALNDQGHSGASDIGVIARRFRAFECISNGQSNLIESGLGRLGLQPELTVSQQNSKTLTAAADRPATAQKWQQSLGQGTERSQVRETAAPNYAPRMLSWADTLQSLVWTGAASGGFALADQLRGVASFEGLGIAAMAATGAVTLATLPRLGKAARLAWRNGSLEGSLKEAVGAVIASLASADHLSERESENAVIAIRSSVDGRRDIVVTGVARSTERLIMEAIAEVLGPIQNPRYLMVRNSWIGPFARKDYHAVPTALGARKKDAEVFAGEWRQKVGNSQLVFTRSKEGRQVLLKARMRSLAAGFQRSVDRRSAWL